MSRPSRHRYEEIADSLRDGILQGRYSDGRLPSERRLGELFTTQRKTVRRALGLLESQGTLESVGKSGWYVRNPEPQLLTESSRRVMFVTFRRSHMPSSDEISDGIRSVISEHGIELLRYDSSSHEERAHIASIEQLTSVDAGGIAMWPHGPVDRSLLARLHQHTPVVLLDRRVFGFESDSVRFDDRDGGRQVTEHLLQKGHERIAFFGDEPFAESVQSRWHGYRQALEVAGKVPDETLTVMTYSFHEPVFTMTVKTLVGRKDAPTAIVCSNDSVATRILLILREMGVRVPDDIAVTGFGNDSPTYLDLMGLTSISQSFRDLGQAAGTLLMGRIGRPVSARNLEYHDQLLPMQLVVRSSSGG